MSLGIELRLSDSAAITWTNSPISVPPFLNEVVKQKEQIDGNIQCELLNSEEGEDAVNYNPALVIKVMVKT